jgi:hypothetical protein
MYNHVDGWDWLWMTLMTGVAVKLAQGDRSGRPSA